MVDNSNNPIYSKQIERHVLSGLLRNPQIFPDVDTFIGEKDFYKEIHATIFSIIRESLLKNEEVDKVLIASKIKNLGISFEDHIDVFDYIENLFYTQITQEATVEACKDLAKLRVSREIFETFDEGQRFVKKNLNKPVDEIIAGCDKIYGDKISSYELGDEPQNLFEDMIELIENKGKEPQDENGFLTPYPEFNKFFGGLLPKNIYAVISRPGEGKSTWINDVCFKTAVSNNIKCLLLDTEMSTEETQFRMMASISGVPLWYLQTGNWRKNPEMYDKVREAEKLIGDYSTDRIYNHYHVGRFNIDELCSIVRRWYYSKVGRGNPCLIGYDYIKLTGEKVEKNWAEYQAIGEKIDKLKRLSEEIGAPIVTAMQQNRSNKFRGELVDDASTAAQSDRLQWFASFMGILRRKSPEEIANDTREFGSHKLIPLKTRFQGKDAAGHQDLIRRTIEEEVHGRTVSSTKWVQNFLNYDIDNFRVEEKGSLRHLVDRESDRFEIEDANPNDNFGDIL